MKDFVAEVQNLKNEYSMKEDEVKYLEKSVDSN